ncbi:MAG TPA: polymer-forming cytoskeletal protein [Bryobacteraceae bacterium]|jgi:cytoskeletal protein CcmA (bactofilin family)
MKLICPTCGSKDLWQPHTKTSFDRILETHGYGRYDCRNCWKRSIFKFDRKQFQRRETVVEMPVREQNVREQKIAEPSWSPSEAVPVPVPLRPEEATIIGPSVLISGEIFSREGMTVRGVLEGTLTMEGFRLVIEAGGNVSADVTAGSIAVCRDGTLAGQVRTPSFVVDDGANFNGKIEMIAN